MLAACALSLRPAGTRQAAHSVGISIPKAAGAGIHAPRLHHFTLRGGSGPTAQSSDRVLVVNLSLIASRKRARSRMADSIRHSVLLAFLKYGSHRQKAGVLYGWAVLHPGPA
jgi:hypothetical protein